MGGGPRALIGLGGIDRVVLFCSLMTTCVFVVDAAERDDCCWTGALPAKGAAAGDFKALFNGVGDALWLTTIVG